jgi:hypothetical protein
MTMTIYYFATRPINLNFGYDKEIHTMNGLELYANNMRRKYLDEAYYKKCDYFLQAYSEECTSRPMTQEEKEKYQC